MLMCSTQPLLTHLYSIYVRKTQPNVESDECVFFLSCPVHLAARTNECQRIVLWFLSTPTTSMKRVRLSDVLHSYLVLLFVDGLVSGIYKLYTLCLCFIVIYQAWAKTLWDGASIQNAKCAELVERTDSVKKSVGAQSKSRWIDSSQMNTKANHCDKIW